MFGQEGCLFVLMVTFKIIVRYFIHISTAKAFRIRRHGQTFSTQTLTRISDSCIIFFSRCYWYHHQNEINLTHLMKFRARDDMVCLFMSGKQSLSLSLHEESSVEAVEDILFLNLKTSPCRLYIFFCTKTTSSYIRT